MLRTRPQNEYRADTAPAMLPSLRGFVSLAGAAVIALLVPFVILLAGRRSRSPVVGCSSY